MPNTPKGNQVNKLGKGFVGPPEPTSEQKVANAEATMLRRERELKWRWLGPNLRKLHRKQVAKGKKGLMSDYGRGGVPRDIWNKTERSKASKTKPLPRKK